jgi:ubiquinone/menaquinone biosynthesis C-methylase UbiE
MAGHYSRYRGKRALLENGWWIDASRSDLHVTLVNLEPQSASLPTFTRIVGDGRHLPQFPDKSFDIVFSNSTIEHVGTTEDHGCMAAKVRRIGKRYYVQTPNRNFDRAAFLSCRGLVSSRTFESMADAPSQLRVGSKNPDSARALSEVTSIHLLSKRQP